MPDLRGLLCQIYGGKPWLIYYIYLSTCDNISLIALKSIQYKHIALYYYARFTGFSCHIYGLYKDYYAIFTGLLCQIYGDS